MVCRLDKNKSHSPGGDISVQPTTAQLKPIEGSGGRVSHLAPRPLDGGRVVRHGHPSPLGDVHGEKPGGITTINHPHQQIMVS